jgi:hypothetical protein
MGVAIDMSINLGHILTLAGFLVGGAAFVWAVKSDVRVINTQIASIGDAVKELTTGVRELLVATTEHEQRLNFLEGGSKGNSPRQQRRQSGSG